VPWFPVGEAIRAARERRGSSLEALAERAGITVAALHRLESGRTRTIRPATLDTLAGALRCAKDELARHAPRGAAPPSPRAKPKPSAPEPTPLTARTLVDVRTACRAHEGRLFRARCRLRPEQEPLSRLDRIALGCSRTGVGGRFVILLGVGPRGPRATVYSITPRATLDLQDLAASGASTVLDLRLRVVVTPADHPTVMMSSEDAKDSDHFFRHWPGGFQRQDSAEPVPLAFVVEAIDGRNVRPPAKRGY